MRVNINELMAVKQVWKFLHYLKNNYFNVFLKFYKLIN